jgi:RimJ/RimL family protein N-acetyltransferase
VTKDIKAGEWFTEENVRVIRSGYGLHPREYENILGKVALTDLTYGTPMKAAYVKDYLKLLPAEEKDCRLIFEWANDPDTRQASFQTAAIPWETHEKWYRDSLQRKDRELLICYHMDTPVGQLRIDTVGETATLSYSIAKGYRNRGYGIEMARAGEEWIRSRMPHIKTLCAEIKPENESSRKMLGENGYTESVKDGHILCTKQIGQEQEQA